MVEVTARVHQGVDGWRVVGLSRTPSLAFAPRSVAFEVPVRLRLQTDRETACAAPMDFVSTSKTRSLQSSSSPAWQLAGTSPKARTTRPARQVRGPLMGFSKVALPSTHPVRVLSPPPDPKVLQRSALGSHPSCTFRPCRFSRLRRLAPRSGLRVCCTPQPIMGFARFQEALHHFIALPPGCRPGAFLADLAEALSTRLTAGTSRRPVASAAAEAAGDPSRRLAPSTRHQGAEDQPPDAPGGLWTGKPANRRRDGGR